VLHSLSDQLTAQLGSLDRHHRLRSSPCLDGRSRVRVAVGGVSLTSFSSNDYLGLATHPSLERAAAEASAALGFGAGASRLVSGTFAPHLALEDALATLVHSQAALVFPSGYHANLGAVTALVGPSDLIVADRAVHASLIDGFRLSRAKLAVYPHLDTDRARHHLRHLGPRARRRLLVTESLFSMDGDFAPLPELSAIAADHDAILLVDEAHAVGTLGPRGAGLCAHLGVQPDVLIGTLGKAFGASGAFVAGDAILRDHLLNTARTFLFTTAPPPSIAAAALAALHIITAPDGERRRANLTARVAQLRQALGLAPAPVSSPILPVLLGDDAQATLASSHLRSRGFWVPAIRPPTVREGTARLRITISAEHTPEDITALADSLAPFLPGSPRSTVPPQAPFPAAPPSPSDRRGLVILGTDTGVGKSTVAAALLSLLSSRGLHPVPFKPVETGASPHPADAHRLLAATLRTDLPIEVVCPFCFSEPIAPAAAAEKAGLILSIPALTAAAAAAQHHGNPLVVETPGGLLSPLGPRISSADLAGALGLPVLLVARNALGTVNHTALAVAEIRRRRLPLLGIVLVDTDPNPTPDRATNAALIADATGLQPLGTLPFSPSSAPSLLASSLQATVDLGPILEALT
jgi:8-amino-7-oxononanoate synthase/dethiobiotin synthase